MDKNQFECILEHPNDESTKLQDKKQIITDLDYSPKKLPP